MSAPSQKVLASIGFWSRMGLTAAEIVERVMDQYPGLGAAQINQDLKTYYQFQLAGQDVQSSPGNLPLSFLQLPQNPGQESNFEYRVMVPLYDPTSEETMDQLVIIRSDVPLTYSELESRGIAEAGVNLEKYPGEFVAESGGHFRVDVLSQNVVQVVSASTWAYMANPVAFGS